MRERLQQLAVAHGRKCGYRRLTALLRREGYLANKKRVLRLMQEDNLLSLRKAKYVLTTDSQHDLPVYPNLTRRLTLSGLNQLWIADITYIRLRSEFVFLAVVLDAYSRRVIGWELGRRLHASLATRALEMALQDRTWQPGALIHHSDRGVQYASREYTKLLAEHEIRISMSRRGSPYENQSQVSRRFHRPWNPSGIPTLPTVRTRRMLIQSQRPSVTNSFLAILSQLRGAVPSSQFSFPVCSQFQATQSKRSSQCSQSFRAAHL